MERLSLRLCSSRLVHLACFFRRIRDLTSLYHFFGVSSECTCTADGWINLLMQSRERILLRFIKIRTPIRRAIRLGHDRVLTILRRVVAARERALLLARISKYYLFFSSAFLGIYCCLEISAHFLRFVYVFSSSSFRRPFFAISLCKVIMHCAFLNPLSEFDTAVCDVTSHGASRGVGM